MNSFTKKIVFLYISVYLIISILRLSDIITNLFFISTIYAGIINLINAFAAVKLFEYSFKSGGTSFLIYNLGGLGVRLTLLLIIFILVIKFLNIDEYGFILVFFLFYFISLIFEVLYFLRTSKKIE